MAGGAGTRLWPASTSARPKQFLAMPRGASRHKAGDGEAQSFLRAAIERAFLATGDSPDGRVVVIANKTQTGAIIEDCASLGAREKKRLIIIPEPLARNTAPAIACALLYIDWISAGRDRNILVLTSDHIIHPLNIFRTDANAASDMAQADKLVVFGIQGDRPETGYGYIETSGALTVPPDESVRSRRRYEPEIFSVASFREKPDLEKAKAFIRAKRFYWNSGMFAFSSKFMIKEFRKTAPEVITPFNRLMAPNELSCLTRKGLRILEEWDNMEIAYRKTKAISFDYAVAEKCRNTVMVKAGFSWTDVGSWDEYAKLAGNSGAEVYGTEESKASCFVDSDLPVALCGVEDLVIVARSGRDGGPPAVMISRKGATQQVREIVEEIRARGRTELL